MRVVREDPRKGEAVGHLTALVAPLVTLALGLVGVLVLWPAWLVVVLCGSALLAAYWTPAEEVRARHAAAWSISIGCGVMAGLIWCYSPVGPFLAPRFEAVPIGIVSVLVVYPAWLVVERTAQAFWAKRRRFPGVWECTFCGYDLTGNTTGRCPECGRYLNLQQMRLVREQRKL